MISEQTSCDNIFSYVRRHVKELLLAALISLFPVLVFTITVCAGLDWDVIHTYMDEMGISDPGYIFNYDSIKNMCTSIILMYIVIYPCIYLCLRFRRKTKFSATDFFALMISIAAGLLISDNLTACSSWIIDGDMIDCVKSMAFFILPMITIVWPAFPDWIRKKGPQDHPWFVWISACIFTVISSFLILELQLNGSITVQAHMIPANLMYWLLAYLLLYVFTLSTRVSSTICLLAAWFIGAANLELMQWRGDYILPSDLQALQTAMNVAGHYRLIVNRKLIAGIILTIALLLFVWLVPGCPHKKKHSWKIHIAAALIAVELAGAVGIVMTYTDFLSNQISSDMPDTESIIDSDGYILYFFVSLRTSGKIEIEDYDPTVVQEILSAETPEEASRYPTIIVIQNESFSDPRCLIDIKTDKPIMPYLDSLTENTQKGFVYVPTQYGPTAFSEFEFLTGTSMRFLPSGTNPFIRYIKTETPSIASVLKAQDAPYRSVMFHPYNSNSYNRETVYPLLGFDKTIFYETWEDKQTIRDMVTDEQNYLDLIQIYENQKADYPDNPLFLFNITIQNHGGYFEDMPEWEDPVTITNFDAMHEINMYVNLLHMSDSALHILIDYFQNVDEDVIILMYGDHQAYYSDNAKEQFFSYSWITDEKEMNYQKTVVPYFIWANFDIEEKDEIHDSGITAEYDLHSINMMGPELLKLAGVKLSPFDQYLLDLHETYPVITQFEVKDADGNRLIDDTMVVEEADDEALIQKLQEYEQIQYNLLFDSENKAEGFTP